MESGEGKGGGLERKRGECSVRRGYWEGSGNESGGGEIESGERGSKGRRGDGKTEETGGGH